MTTDTTASSPSIVTTLLNRFRSYRRWLLGLGTLLGLYALAGFLLVPSLIQRYAPEYVRTSLHRELSLGDVQFNPFTFSLRIDQAQLREANGAAIAGFTSLHINAELSSLFTGSYNFKSIQLNAPTLQAIVNAQGKLNLAFNDLDSPEATDTGNAPLPAIRIGELELINGQIHLEDNSLATPFKTDLRPIQFTLRDFRTEPQHGNAFHFSGASQNNETFDWQGDFTVQPFGSKGSLQLGNLQASTLQNYLQDALPFKLLAGAMDIQGEYQLSIADQTELALTLPSITVRDTRIAPAQGDDTAWVSVPRVQLDNTRLSLQKRSVDIQHVLIEQAQLNSWLDADYNLNLLQLLGPDEPPSDAPWTSSVDTIELRDAQIQVEDRSVSPAAQFALNPVQLTVRKFSTAPGTTIDLDTQLRINTQAEVIASGTVHLDTLRSQLQLNLKNLPLADLQTYASASTDLVVRSGALSADGEVFYKGDAAGKEPEVRFAGAVDISNLSTQDAGTNQDFIKWRSLQMRNLVFSLAPDVLEVEQVIAREPYGRVIINSDASTNIQKVLRMPPASEDDAKDSASTTTGNSNALRTRIKQVTIENGSANFADYSVTPAFATGMQRLNGSITGLSSTNGTRATVKLEGSVDNYAPVSISGEANFLAADTYSDLALNFRNMELTTFNPYSGKFAGYSIAKGKLATELRYQIRDRKLDAQHHIVIDQLEFGAATDSKDAVPLPIKLAVALLKDRNGVIDITLPVSGSIDDPQFRVGPIVWKAFVGLLTKIVTAPFSALGSLFGGGDELAYVDFAPGSADLSASELEKLDKLGKALVERPALKLDIPLTVVTDTDAAALNEAAFAKALSSALGGNSNPTPAQQLAALNKLAQARLGTTPATTAAMPVDATAINARIAELETQLKPLYAISAADRDALTRARADAVQAVLLDNPGLSAERVFLTARSNDAQSPEGAVRMALVLE